MAWFYLILGGFFEMGWAIGIKLSTTMKVKFWGISIAAVSMILALFLLYQAQKTLPIGTAYAVWTGIGAVATVIMGIILFDEPTTFWRMFSLMMIIGGVIGLNLSTT